jgi:tetratricopeptide (TPR) repeat protein
MRRLAVLTLVGLTGVAAACAPKAPPAAAVVTTPKYPDFLRPRVPDEWTRTASAINLDWGWRALQADDLKEAEVQFSAALRASSSFYPAETGRGYLELARERPAEAVIHFDRALERRPQDPSALVGRGQALSSLSRDAEAADAFERAMAADSSLSHLEPRIAVLRFRGVERDLTAAREAAKANDMDRAVSLYNAAIARSPESGFLYRELAVIERQQGNTDRAIEHLRRAAALDPSDVSALTQLGELLEASGDLAGAATAYDAALAIDANPAVAARRKALAASTAAAQLPEPFREMAVAAEITRGDLAALIAFRLSGLLQGSQAVAAPLMTDIRGHWAEASIIDVARAGVLRPYENHTFQPRGTIRRVDLADAVSRLLPRIAALTPARPRPWENSRGRFTDVAATHLSYPAVSMAVASGVVTVGANNDFQPSRPVSGAEAMDAMGRLEALTNTSGRSTAGR